MRHKWIIMASITYVATCELENISLTLPPATLRNAAPLYPQINRKIRYTAVDTHHVNHTRIKGPNSHSRAQDHNATHVHMSGANATGNIHTKNRANETR